MVTFLQKTFTSLVHAHAGRTQKKSRQPNTLHFVFVRENTRTKTKLRYLARALRVMLSSMHKKLTLIFTVTLISSCAFFIDPHEIFISHMQGDVGEKINGPNTWAPEGRLIKKEVLPNGNFENEYHFRRTCRYFFEYEPSTLTIVSWRYEGEKSDCHIYS